VRLSRTDLSSEEELGAGISSQEGATESHRPLLGKREGKDREVKGGKQISDGHTEKKRDLWLVIAFI